MIVRSALFLSIACNNVYFLYTPVSTRTVVTDEYPYKTRGLDREAMPRPNNQNH